MLGWSLQNITMKRQLLMGVKTLSLAMLLGACSSIATKFTPSKQVAPARTNADASLQVSNLTRLYDLHIPSSYHNQKPMPLVLVFHGASGDGRGMAQMTGFNQVAEKEGFIAAYPDAIGGHWNSLRGNKPDTTNDVGFVAALIDKLSEQYNIDRRRIYITGFSNGGMFAQRLACELGDKIAAASIVSATMPDHLSRICQSTKPISMLFMHGTDDPVIPYGPPGKALLSLADTVKFWNDHNQCVAKRNSEVLPHVPQVRLDTYQNCTNKTDVMLYTIEGGGHAWSGAEATPDPSGNTPQPIKATEVIWNFFSKYSKPEQG